MRTRAATWTLLAISALLLAIMVISISPVDGDKLIQPLDIEEEAAVVTFEKDPTGIAEVNVTVRSTSTRTAYYTISASISGNPLWSVEHPDSLYLEPMEEWRFRVTIRVPAGTPPSDSAELTVSMSSEGGIVVGSDSCRVIVMPHVSTELAPAVDYLVDMPSSGSFRVKVVNTGNVRTPVALVSDGPWLDTVGTADLLLEAGGVLSLEIDYDVSGMTGENTTRLRSIADGLESDHLDITFMPDGELFHIMFGGGPFLVLLPGPGSAERVRLMSIGGTVSDVGIEVVVPDDGSVTLEYDELPDEISLERVDARLSASGLDGDSVVVIRAFGFHEDRMVVSNELPVVLKAHPGESKGPDPVLVTAIGGGGGAVLAGLVGTFAYLYSASEVLRYKWLLLTFIPLYSTIHGERVLDHFFRGRLYEYIKENPGATFTALKEHFDVKNGTLTYHLHRLEQEELITHRNVGKYKLFYVDGVRVKGVEAVISPLDREMINIITENPGITSKRMISMLSGERSNRTLSRHIKQLERKGFIRSEVKGGQRHLYLTNELERVLLPKEGVLEMKDLAVADI